MKVVLINPPQPTRYPQPPIGLVIIAAVLEREEHQVAILDANALRIKSEKVAPYVIDADVVGLTAMTPTINEAANIAHQLKQANSNLPIILGGAHATLLSEETMAAIPEVDVIVRGEGERTVIDLMWALEHKLPLDDIQGISYRKDSEVVSNHARSITTNVDLDSLPFLAYHLLPWRKYKRHPPYGRASPFATIITSRGCPYRCSFCSKDVFGYKFRAQSPERVVEEIAYCKEKFGVKEIAFYDDVFTLNKGRAYAIADGIMKSGLKIRWTCETRVNLVDKDLLRHMKQAGCYAIAYGIESASQEILNALHKDITLEQVEETVHTTQEAGMQTIGYFMIGSPWETPETIANTIEFAKKLKLDFAQFAITIPFPGTELYNSYLKTSTDDVPWENFTYEGMGKGVTPIFESDELSRADLQHWVKQAYKEFYLRPSYLWQRIRRVRSVGDFKVDLRGAFMLLGNIKR